MTTSAALSTDAVRLALTNNIDIIFADSSGFPIGRVWHSKLGSTTAIRKAQLEASLGPIGVSCITDWLIVKLRQQADFLKELKKRKRPTKYTLRVKTGGLTFAEKVVYEEATESGRDGFDYICV